MSGDATVALLAKLRSNAASVASGRGASASSTQAVLSECSALIMELRGRNECEVETLAAGAGEVERAKRRHAEADDELRALKYQRSRIKRAIAECAEPPRGAAEAGETEVCGDSPSLALLPSCSAFGVRIAALRSQAVLSELISLEEAMRVRGDQPGTLAAGSGTHQQMLYRLGVERDERARLRDVRDALMRRKTSLAAAAAASAEVKAKADGQMETVIAAAASLQQQMSSVGHAGAPDCVHELLPLLPSPLYTLALTASAYFKSVGADATIQVTGDVDAARALADLPRRTGDSDSAGATPVEEASFAPHPLSVVIQIRGGAAEVTVRYFNAFGVLAAAATPPAAEASLRRLYARLPRAKASSTAPAGGPISGGEIGTGGGSSGRAARMTGAASLTSAPRCGRTAPAAPTPPTAASRRLARADRTNGCSGLAGWGPC